MRTAAGTLAALSLAACMAAPFLYLWSYLSQDGYKSMLLAGSIGWFIFATLWVARRDR
jgi:hypothetical protein